MVLVGAATSARTMTAPDVAAAVHAGLTTTADTTGLEDTLADAATNVSASCCAAVVFTDKFDSRLAWHEDIIVGFFLIIVGVTSVLGNGSSLVMFWRRRRHLTPAEVLLVNLAIMHLFLALASYPAPMISSFAHRWLFGDLGCQLYGFVCYVLGVATIISITALAVVRYLKTCTYTYSRMLTLQHMKLVLVAVYIYSLFWALLPLFQVISNYEVEPFGVSCTLNWANPSNSARVYILLVVMLVVALPSLVMIWCYTKILLLVHRNRRKKLIISKRSATSQGPSELQITLVSGLVCLGFLVAWMPYAVVSIMYGLMGKAAPVYASLAPVLLAKSSCAYNPIIYIFINARYRSEMMGILQERLGPLLCCPPRQDHPHQHQDPPESTSVMSRVPRESSATEEDLPLEVLDRTNHTPDLQAVTDRPPLTSSHHHNHTLHDCRDAPHCVPGSSHDHTDGEGQSSEADEVPDQAAGWSLPSTGQLKSFSCDDIHPLYHFPDQKGHQRLSFTGSQGRQSAKPSNTEPQNIEEMVESISVGGRSPDSCSRVDACVSFLRDDEGSFSSPGGIQDFQPNMIPLLVTMRVTTVVSPSELITDISPFTKFLESPSSDAVSEQSEADTSPSAEPGGSNVSPEEFQSDDRLSPAEELQARSTTSTRVFTPPAVSLSYNLSQTSTLEENCEATVNASTEDLVSTVTTTTNDFPRSVPETGQQTVVRTPSTNDVSPMPSTPTVHVASTASSPAATPTQESSPSSSDTPTSTKREALPPSEAPAVGPLTRPARPTVRR